MSTLDAQILTLSSMLVRDVLGPLSAKGEKSSGIEEAQQVRAGRWFGLFLAIALFALSMMWGQSVFQIAAFAFSGYVMLVPTLFFGVRWRRFTARAAISSIVVGNFVLFAGTAGHFPLFGFLPVFWGLVAATLTALVVTHFDEAPTPESLERAFG
jgi:Na+/proline symporter